jgi:hypothetical protein
MAAFLWQAGDFGVPGTVAPVAEQQHLRYERRLELPAGAAGTACAVLDARAYADAASWSEGDLRIFRADGRADRSKPQEEVPFEVSYSAAQPTDAVTATVQNLRMQQGDIVFDLAMPRRAYTVVDLNLAARNFIGTAEVAGSDGRGGPTKMLGTFTLFDFAQEHLARSTVLALQETSFVQLHVKLRLHRIGGGALPGVSTAMVLGASVPASREAQTLYTVVATTGNMEQVGTSTVAEMDVPAHVPIERVNFMLDPEYKADFLRSVRISAGRDAEALARPDEATDGEIWRVTRAADAAGDGAIHGAKLAQIAVIASNLRDPAKVRIEIRNGGEAPLPIKAIQLEMRQRTICFDATVGSTYMLRYGDDALRASVYDLDGLAKMRGAPLVAVLGPEELNREYVARKDEKTYGERNPEMIWIVVLAAIVALGAFASRQTKRRGRHR